MKRYVLDASVAAKWFLSASDETLVEEALELLRLYSAGAAQIFVPELFFPEFGNILWKAEQRGRCDSRTTDQALDAVVEQNFPTFPASPRLKQAAQMARQFRRTVYDCLYVALAVETGAILITADQKLVNSLARQLPVAWLGTLQH